MAFSSVHSKLSKDDIDSIWNNPDHLDLLEMKKSSLIPITQNQNSFLHVLPCIRRLFTIFDSIYPNIYRIHCSDSLRIFNEIVCLTDEYLHITPSTIISANELLSNEKYFDDFISLLRRPSIIRSKTFPTIKNELYCFGQGIQPYNKFNQLHQTSLFCFELTMKDLSVPIYVLIHDPNEELVPTDIKYINTYHQGHTRLFSCSYTPITKAGIYKISFVCENLPLSNQEYSVYIHHSKSSPEIPEYELEGDGCSTKIILNSTARFRLKIKSLSSPSIIDFFLIEIHDPHGHKIVVQRRLLAPDLLELTYQPMSIGEHQLKILFNNQIHRQMTIDVINDEMNYLSKLKPFGPGLKRAIVGLPTEFYVDLNQTTNDNIHFRLEPSYQAEIDYEQQLATVRYVPINEGNCPVHILENDKDISSSPFLVHVKKNLTVNERPRIRVVGLSNKLILHRPIEFQVFVDNPFDDLSNHLHIDILTDDDNSPSVSIHRRPRSSYLCSFIPVTLGKYIISIDYDGIIAEHNPFHCQVTQEKDILLTGPAINNQCLPLNEPTHFCFALKDFLMTDFHETNATYESGYSSNDDISSKSSSSNDLPTSTSVEEEDGQNNYRVTITDGHGNIKPNVLIKEIFDSKTDNNNVRVDFTPDEKILYINISCTW